MMKIYEKPMVELTKFNAEDIIATSTIDTAEISNERKEIAASHIETAGTYDAVGIFNW